MGKNRSFLIPVCVDDTREANADIPDSFAAAQWTRLPAGETRPAFVERVSRLLSSEPALTQISPTVTAVPNIAMATRQPAPTAVALRTIRVLLAIAALAVIMLGYFALDKFVLSKRGAQSVTASTRAVPAATPEKSIAVLPFVDMSEKHDQEYFADGMAEEILNLLVKIPKLKVIGRTSSFSFKGKTVDLKTIGATLGATYVVEGSVRRSGDHLRVTARLIDTRDGAHRWSGTHDRDASDVLKVQDEIAASLVRALQLEVTASSRLQGQPLPRNGEAYDSYLRGLHAWNRYDQHGFEEAVIDFRRALEVNPSFAPAAEGLARVLSLQSDFGFASRKTGYEQARAAAEAALKLDPNSALAHAVLGDVHTVYDWDWPAAAREMKIAVALAPTDPRVLILAGYERLAVGQWIEALHYLDAAITADPLHAGVYTIVGFAYLRLGRFAEAENAARRVLEISPTYAWAHVNLGLILLMEGKTEAAVAEVQKEMFLEGQTAGFAFVYQALHRTKEADAELAGLEAGHSGDRAAFIAAAYAFRGQKDQAFMWLDRAYAQKDNDLWLIKGDPFRKIS